jgi:hypothetical protein
LILCALMNLTISAPSINSSISMLFRIHHILSILTGPNIFLNICLSKMRRLFSSSAVKGSVQRSIPNFTEIGQGTSEMRVEIQVRPWVKSWSCWGDSYKTLACLTTFCEELLYRISSRFDKRCNRW